MRSLHPPFKRLSLPPGRVRWRAIAEALRAALARGSFEPGQLLPSTRDLALSFGAHRHTVLVALDALAAEGLVAAEARVGYRVCAASPALHRTQAASAPEYRFRVVRHCTSAPEVGGVRYPLHAATPDPALLPLRELRACYAHVLGKHAARTLEALDERGLPALRSELSKYLRRARGVAPEALLLTSGSQDAIALVAHTLLGPGDAVAVEDPGYCRAWDAFRDAGAELLPVRVDAHGLDVEALARLCRRRRVRLLYITPNHQFPTTVTLSASRRAALLELTLQHDVAILEDDYDHEYHFRGEPQAPLFASAGAPHVAYVATLSKLVAPAVRVGLIAGSEPLIRELAARRSLGARGGDGVTQAALAEWIGEGGFERHLRRARRAYSERRDAALRAVADVSEGLVVEHTAPDGGLALWTRWPELDVLALARRALTRGVAVLPEPLMSTSGGGHGIRLAYGRVEPQAFAAGVSILADEARRLRP
jgi:GntR family transcriptional regulator/MocR family aminotransferase